MLGLREIDPRELRLPASRPDGADPVKLHRQISQFGRSLRGIPPIIVFEARDGVLVIYDGVTRATRAAKLLPGVLVTVDVIGRYARGFLNEPTVGDRLP